MDSHAHLQSTLLAGILVTFLFVEISQSQDVNPSTTNSVILASLEEIPFMPSIGHKVPLNILLEPDIHWKGKNYVPTGALLNATAEIMDHRFKDFNFTYKWSASDHKLEEGPNLTQISFNYSKPSEFEILNLTISLDDKYHGFKNKDVVVRDPIMITNQDLKLFVEHGELVKANFKFNGTPPFYFCYKFCPLPEIICDDCYINRYDGRTTSGELKIAHYLHINGNYTLILKLDNIATTVIKKYSVKVSDTVRPKKIPYVPIISSISAVLIILIALALHVRLRETNFTETADFDFIRNSYDEEEWYEEQSFWQRVKYLLFKADSSENRGLLSSDPNRSRLM